METLEKALKMFEKAKETEECEKVLLTDSIGRIIAKDIVSGYDFPPYNRSAMDGFAFKYEDISDTAILKIKGESFAGHPSLTPIEKGECVRIMTGGVVPESCDTVVEFEVCDEKDGKIYIKKIPSKFANIAFRGEDLKKGETALRKGEIVTDNKINLIASLGIKYIELKRELKIGVISTGDELVDVEDEISGGKIRDSSKYSLETQIKNIHQKFVDLGRTKDDENEIRSKIEMGFDKKCDIILITGGSSEGDKDYTQKILKDLKANIMVNKIAIKPGAPTVIATIERKREMWILGMPGNPVSTYLTFKMILIPLVEKMLCTDKLHSTILEGIFEGTFNKKQDRMHFVPCVVEGKTVKKLKYNGSGDFTTLSKANAFFIVPLEVGTIKDKEPIKYFMI